MSDAMSLKGHFSRARGWNEEKVNRLVVDLLKVMSDHNNHGFQFRSCTALRDDYERAKREYPTLRPIEAICVNYCVGGLAVPKDHEVMLYFDRGEPFMKQINRVWLRQRRLRKPGWAQQTRNIIPVDSGTYAIQAADFIAWSVNREQTHGDYPQRAFSAKMISDWKLYDYAAIVERYANDKWS